MRRPIVAAALACAAAALPSSASGAGFAYGVSAAEVSSSSALLWGRAPKAGKVHLEVALNRRFARVRIRVTVTAAKANDLTVQVRVRKLQPATRYYYFFHQGKQRSEVGTFTTAPKSSAAKTIRFAVTGDTDGIRTASGQLYRNKDGADNFATYKAMAREKNDFDVNLGDTMYSDGSSDHPVPFAFSLAQKRAKYRENLGYANLTNLRKSGVVYNQWDDHEFIDDFNRHSQACDVGSVFSPQYPCNTAAIFKAGVQAFREYMPVTYSAKNGTYRTFRWGKNLEVFILDERSFRSLRASEVKDNPAAPEPTPHVCENPAGSGQDDPAPQVPQRIRSLFSLLYPPAANPARPECLNALNDPQRTMLGSRQYAAFTKAIRASEAKWKIIMNEVPIMAFGISPYDDWQGYEFEREKLLGFLKANVKNVAFMTTDFHSNWVNDARIKTFPEEGGPIDSEVMDFLAGGVSDNLFGNEVDEFTGTPGSWKPIDSLFMTKPPPDGPGMQCSNTVTFGYTEVTATTKKLTVELKDDHGRQMTNALDGKPCGPYVLAAR